MISFYEDVIRRNKERVHSEAARPLMQIRRQRGEAPFGYFKAFGGLRRMAGRGLAYAEKKALVAALGWNLLLLVKSITRSGTKWPIFGLIQLAIALLQAITAATDDKPLRPIGKARTSVLGHNPREQLKRACLSAGC